MRLFTLPKSTKIVDILKIDFQIFLKFCKFLQQKDMLVSKILNITKKNRIFKILNDFYTFWQLVPITLLVSTFVFYLVFLLFFYF